jgi:hypothetical protein
VIAKGTPHANGARLAAYLVTGKDGETAELYELRGFAEADIVAAFRSEHVIARGTRCEQPFFHCQVRNPAGEQLSRAQWEKVAGKIESKLGLTGQPRAVAFHKKDGHEHMHVAWSRIDRDTLKAKPLPFYKLRLKEVCRALEVEFGLTMVRNEREATEPKAASRAERDQANRLGVDIEAVRQNIRDAWTRSDSGQAFVAALSAEGMTLCKGDRRDYVVIDGQGGIHALGKRLLGVSAADTRARLDGLGPADSLPTIEVAREALGRRDLQPHTQAVPPAHPAASQVRHTPGQDGDDERKRGAGRPATASENAGMVAQNAEANRRHLALNPFLRPEFGQQSQTPAKPVERPTLAEPEAKSPTNDKNSDKTDKTDKQRRIEERAAELMKQWEQAKGLDLGRDR